MVYAFAESSPRHEEYRRFLTALLEGDEAYAYSESVLASFVRIVTHPAVFSPPSSLDEALQFAQEIRSAPQATRMSPGPRHWEIFTDLCRAVDAKGNLVPDAYLAALAIETGSEWITTDRDFARFPGLRWRHPLVP